MTPEQVTATLDLIKRSSDDHSVNLNRVMESHSDHVDRAIAQAAQLKLLNESLPSETIDALKEVAMSGSPL